MLPALAKYKNGYQKKQEFRVLISGIRTRNSVLFVTENVVYSERRKSSTCCCCVFVKQLNAPTELQASLGWTTVLVEMQ
jgi:hypothetical protein